MTTRQRRIYEWVQCARAWQTEMMACAKGGDDQTAKACRELRNHALRNARCWK